MAGLALIKKNYAVTLMPDAAMLWSTIFSVHNIPPVKLALTVIQMWLHLSFIHDYTNVP